MNSSKSISYIFRKSPIVRALVLLVLAGVIIAATTITSIKVKAQPVIEEVIPPIGSPGDIITIRGTKFGTNRDTSYVEVGGSRITASSYLSWSDTEIRFVLPPNVKNGLVFVGAGTARSEPSFFANENDIPRLAPASTQSTNPSITSITINGTAATNLQNVLRVKSGDLLVISGTNFGNTNDNADVLFSSAHASAQAATHESDLLTEIPASRNNYDYVYWSENEIRVYVPDGISDGMFYVKNSSGQSQQIRMTNSSAVGKKSFPVQRTYLIETTSDISDAVTEQNATIAVRMPRPQQTVSQPKIGLTEYSPNPSMTDFQHTIIFQEQASKAVNEKISCKANFVVSVFEVATEINVDKVSGYDRMNSILKTNALKADKCVPSDDERVIELAAEIVGKERNPYRKAKKIYDYIIDNYELMQITRSGDVSPVDMIESKSGDIYDFAILFTALLRSSGVPAFPCSGLLVDRAMNRRVHWWAEFYIMDFGWVPVDVALGAGFSYNSIAETVDRRAYYFGNMDAQHVLFSRGYNEIKPSSANSVTVQIPRSYALQAIWEETNVSSIRYSSLWNTPRVLGVY